MPDSKITALTSISTSTDPANDPLVIVDVSDTSMAATGTTKKVTLNNLLACSPTATLASATITGDLTVKTNVLKVDTTNNRVGIGTASPALPLEIYKASGDSKMRITSGANSLTIGWDDPNGFYYTANTSLMAWQLSGSTAMTLNATGLGVGRSPISKLTVDKASQTPGGTTPNGALVITDTVGSNLALEFGVNSAALPWIQSRNSTTNTYYDLLLNPNGGNVGIGVTPITSHILSCSGPVGITGTFAGTRTSYITNSSAASIYYTDGGGSGYFTDFGNLIIQPRTSAARSVVIATGSTTPVERAVVKSTGQVRFVPLAADPAGAEAGDVYYNSVSNRLKYYNGTAWTLI